MFARRQRIRLGRELWVYFDQSIAHRQENIHGPFHEVKPSYFFFDNALPREVQHSTMHHTPFLPRALVEGGGGE